MISMAVRFEIDTDNPKAAHTILDVMLTRGWDEPWFRDRRVKYKGIIPQLTRVTGTHMRISPDAPDRCR